MTDDPSGMPALPQPVAWLDPHTGGVCSQAQKVRPHNDCRRFTVPLYA
jgi:hypothetical protein